MNKKLMASAALACCAVLALPTAAQASDSYLDAASSATNHAWFWGDNCMKIEFGDGVKSFTVDGIQDYVVVKAGRTITVYEMFWGGEVSSLSGKDISHIIYCPSSSNS